MTIGLQTVADAVNRDAISVHDEGIYIPALGALASGIYTHSVNGGDVQSDTNMIVNEGLLYLLRTGLLNGTRQPNWYIALNGSNYTPSAALKGVGYPSAAGEIVSQTEGYVEDARQAWIPDAPGESPFLENSSNLAKFTIATASEVVVYGAAILSGSVRGSVADILLSTVKFSKPRTLYDTDVFSMAYHIELKQA